MRIFLVRHGQTDANLEARYCGRTDVPLNGEGREQARALRPLLLGRTFEAVYASPLSRAVETASLLLEDPDAPPPAGLTTAERAARNGILLEDALLEHDFGRFENLTRDRIAAAAPEEMARWNADFMGYVFPGGESAIGMFARVGAFGADLVRRHKGDVLVVSHMGPTVALIASLIGLPDRHMWRLRAGNASLSRVVVGDDGYAFLDLLNIRPYRPEAKKDAWSKAGRMRLPEPNSADGV